MTRVMLGVVGLNIAICATVVAHPGPRIWVSIDGAKVLTFAGPYPPAAPANYSVSSVFTQMLADEGEDVWATDFPGFQRVPGGSIPAATTFSYNIIGPLFWYNAGDGMQCPFFEPVATSFAAAPPVPQMAVTNELFQTRFTSNGFVMGDAAFAYNGSAGDHNHLSYTLLGDGINPEGGPDGIYALPLQLTGRGAISDTFFLLLGKNVTAEELAEAADVILHPRVGPDLDCDGDVDLDDAALFGECMKGPSMVLPPHPHPEVCVRTDLDGDHHADLMDYVLLEQCFSGEGVAAEQGCDD